MKLINYNYGYYPDFNCSIGGKIKMSEAEWKEARKFLLQGAKRWLPSYPWIKSHITEGEKNKFRTKEGYLINIGVSATSVLAKKYNLSRYTSNNYVLLVTTR